VFMIVPSLLQRSVSSVHTQMALRIKYSGLRAADQELRGQVVSSQGRTA